MRYLISVALQKNGCKSGDDQGHYFCFAIRERLGGSVTTGITVSLENWFALAPGRATHEQWRNWANAEGQIACRDDLKPDVSFLPPMQRRRLTLLDKLSLQVAWQCLDKTAGGEKTRTIFASQYGNYQRTYHILQSILASEPVSPAAFSLSVHNAVSGLFSIAREDSSPTTAVSRGPESLTAGFIEAWTMLQSAEASRILLVAYDQCLPELYQKRRPAREDVITAAFLLKGAPAQISPPNPTLRLDWSKDSSPDLANGGEKTSISRIESILRLLLTSEQEVIHHDGRLRWRWRK